MPRITVRVNDETAEWLEVESDRLGRSKAQTGGRCIELLRSEVNRIKPHHFDADADINLMQDDADRVDEVEERLAEVEARLSELETLDDRHDDGSSAERREDEHSPTGHEESPERPHSASQHTPDAGVGVEPEQRVDVRADSVRAEAVDVAEAMEIKGHSTETRQARREALLFAWDYLRGEGRAQSSEIANATFDAFEGELGYSAQQKYRGPGGVAGVSPRRASRAATRRRPRRARADLGVRRGRSGVA